MLLRQTLWRTAFLIAFAAVVFGITGRLAVRQVTHDNMEAVKVATGEIYTNALPESRPDIHKLEVKLYKRVALSTVRERWEATCGGAMWCGLAVGLLAIIMGWRKTRISPQD